VSDGEHHRGEKKVDPTGKRALFSVSGAPSGAPDRVAPGVQNEGKNALFSMPPWRPGTVVVECSSCQVRRRASLVDVGTRLAWGSLWVPWRRHPHWMGCPNCRRHQWCRIGWAE
jgi:hypothetical protein